MVFGLLLAVVSIWLPIALSGARRNAQVRNSIIVVQVVHQVASIFHVLLNGLPTMRLDPLGFNSYAMSGVGRLEGEPYAQFLRFVYSTLGSSHFLGCQVSNLFFALSLLTEIWILKRIGCSRIQATLILIYGLPLSCVFNTAVTLREAAEMFFFLGLVLVLLRVYQEGLGLFVVFLVPIFLCLNKLHHGLIAAVALVLPIGLAWSLKSRPVLLVAVLSMSFTGSFFLLGDVVASLSAESHAFHEVTSGNLGYVQGYAQNVLEGRTDFGVTLDLGSLGGLLSTGPLVYLYYLYSPLPWQVRGMMDVYGLFESMLRLGLTFFAIQGVFQARGRDRDQLILLLIVFLGVEAAWAAGTANWGTAMRHRLVAWGLLVAAGGRGWLLAWAPGESAKWAGTEDLSGAITGKQSIRARRRALRNKSKGVS